MSLQYGVNDFGSTMMEENVVSAAGTQHTDEVNAQSILRIVSDAGYTPVRRNTRYEQVN